MGSWVGGGKNRLTTATTTTTAEQLFSCKKFCIAKRRSALKKPLLWLGLGLGKSCGFAFSLSLAGDGVGDCLWERVGR